MRSRRYRVQVTVEVSRCELMALKVPFFLKPNGDCILPGALRFCERLLTKNTVGHKAIHGFRGSAVAAFAA